jgi:hypothetical protein
MSCGHRRLIGRGDVKLLFAVRDVEMQLRQQMKGAETNFSHCQMSELHPAA